LFKTNKQQRQGQNITKYIENTIFTVHLKLQLAISPIFTGDQLYQNIVSSAEMNRLGFKYIKSRVGNGIQQVITLA